MSSAAVSSSAGSPGTVALSVLCSHLDLSSQLAFSPSLFSSSLTTLFLGRYLLYRPSAPSTQSIIRQLAVESAPSGSLALVEQQTAGRGRVDGRVWLSPAASNLYFTLLLRPLRVQSVSCFSFACAIAVCRAIVSVRPQLQPRVKWPNDVWIGSKKVAGILVDVDIIASAASVAAGIGINVNQSFAAAAASASSASSAQLQPDLSLTATSIRDAAGDGEDVPRELLLASLLNHLEPLLVQPMQSVLPEYRRWDCLVGRRVVVMPRRREEADSHYDAQAVGFSDEGYLLVRAADGEEVRLIAEEVTLKL